MANQAVELFTDPEAVAMLVGVTLAFIAIALIPSPWTKLIGVVFSGILIAKFGYDTFEKFGNAILTLDDACWGSESNEDLEAAGKAFAEECGEPVFNLILALILWKVSEKVSTTVHEYKVARLRIVETLTQDRAAAGLVDVLPAQLLQLVDSAVVLVRKMKLSEWLKAATGVGKQFPVGVEGAKAYSLDEPYVFRREARGDKDLSAYRAIFRINITEAIRQLLRIAVNNNQRIPDAVKHLPRYKWENGRWNILIPKALWSDFAVMFGVVEITVLPLDISDPRDDDLETFTLE